VSSTNHKAPHHVIISILLLPFSRSPKYLPQHFIVEHPHPMSFPSSETPSSGSKWNTDPVPFFRISGCPRGTSHFYWGL